MNETTEVFRWLALSQVVFAAIAFAASDNPPKVKTLATLLMLGLCSYFVLPLWFSELGIASIPMLIASNAIPALLFLLVRGIFDDRFDSMSWVGALSLVYIGFGLYGTGICQQWWSTSAHFACNADADLSYVAFGLLPQLAKLGLATASLVIVIRGYQTDLIEARRRARAWLLAILATAVAAVIVTELLPYQPAFVEPAGIGLLWIVAMLCILLFVNVNPRFTLQFVEGKALRREPRDTQPAEPTGHDPASHSARDLASMSATGTETNRDAALAEAVLGKIRAERIYAEHTLRVADLAARLQMTEARLRQLIHSQLGFRNFNQFINSLRIDECTRRLLTQQELPVMSIALDVGFTSLSVFNQAFRMRHECTPTEYRNHHSARGLNAKNA